MPGHVPSLVVVAVVSAGVVVALLTYALPIRVAALFDRFATYRDAALAHLDSED